MVRWVRPFLGLGLVLLLAGTAAAHAVVYPRQVAPGTFERFVLRVPNEKDDAGTIAVKLEIPAAFQIQRVQPVPGWQYELATNDDGTLRTITWTGGEIKPHEFMDFPFQGRTPGEAGSWPWQAWQTYSDGEVVAWVGPTDSDHPASLVAVAAPAQPPAAAPGATAAPVAPPAAPGPGLAAALPGWGGLLLGALALAVALRRR